MAKHPIGQFPDPASLQAPVSVYDPPAIPTPPPIPFLQTSLAGGLPSPDVVPLSQRTPVGQAGGGYYQLQEIRRLLEGIPPGGGRQSAALGFGQPQQPVSDLSPDSLFTGLTALLGPDFLQQLFNELQQMLQTLQAPSLQPIGAQTSIQRLV